MNIIFFKAARIIKMFISCRIAHLIKINQTANGAYGWWKSKNNASSSREFDFFLGEAGHRREVPGNVMIHIPITCWSCSLEQTRWRRKAGRALEDEHIQMSGQRFILIFLPVISGSSEHFQGPPLPSFILGKSSKCRILDMHICENMCCIFPAQKTWKPSNIYSSWLCWRKVYENHMCADRYSTNCICVLKYQSFF